MHIDHILELSTILGSWATKRAAATSDCSALWRQGLTTAEADEIMTGLFKFAPHTHTLKYSVLDGTAKSGLTFRCGNSAGGSSADPLGYKGQYCHVQLSIDRDPYVPVAVLRASQSMGPSDEHQIMVPETQMGP
jgi:hypothetical protein